MRLSKHLFGLVAVLAMPACLQAADPNLHCCQQTGGGADTAWIGDCAGCNSCNSKLLPALAGGFTRLLDDVFRCPTCRDAGSNVGCGLAARPNLSRQTPLVSINFSGLVKSGRMCGGCWSPSPIETRTALLNEKGTPALRTVRNGEDQIQTRPRTTRLVTKRARPSVAEVRKSAARRAPRPLTVATATWLNNEQYQLKSQGKKQSEVKTVSGTKPKPKIPHNPLRD